MAKLENIYPYTDLLEFANSSKLSDWNSTIELMKKEGIIPFYEAGTRTVYMTEKGDESGYNPLMQKIINAFCKKENIKFITLIDS